MRTSKAAELLHQRHALNAVISVKSWQHQEQLPHNEAYLQCLQCIAAAMVQKKAWPYTVQ